MTGAAALLSGKVATSFSASIGPGVQASGPSSSHTFPTNTCTVSGGVGPFTYAWSQTNDGLGETWSTGTSATLAPAVSGVTIDQFIGAATYICTVTDTGAGGAKAVSNGAYYRWFNTKGNNL